MVVRRKMKKSRKYRGKRAQGYGSHKKHRGKGSRGGRGKAGMHKHKWSLTVSHEPGHFGKHGFKRPIAVVKKVNAINLRQLEAIARDEGKKKIDLAELGYDKVLGEGKLRTALEVVAEAFSKKAVERIEAAGGKAIKIEIERQAKVKQIETPETGITEVAETKAKSAETKAKEKPVKKNKKAEEG